MSYTLIAMAPDGEYVTDSEHETIEDAWRASDWGSKWFFYPIPLVVAERGEIASFPDLLGPLDMSDMPGITVTDFQLFLRDNQELVEGLLA